MKPPQTCNEILFQNAVRTNSSSPKTSASPRREGEACWRANLASFQNCQQLQGFLRRCEGLGCRVLGFRMLQGFSGFGRQEFTNQLFLQLLVLSGISGSGCEGQLRNFKGRRVEFLSSHEFWRVTCSERFFIGLRVKDVRGFAKDKLLTKRETHQTLNHKPLNWSELRALRLPAASVPSRQRGWLRSWRDRRNEGAPAPAQVLAHATGMLEQYNYMTLNLQPRGTAPFRI